MFNRWISIQKAFICLLICKKNHPDLWISSIDILAALTQTSYPTAFCLLGKADIPEVENSFLGQCVKGTSAALSSQISSRVAWSELSFLKGCCFVLYPCVHYCSAVQFAGRAFCNPSPDLQPECRELSRAAQLWPSHSPHSGIKEPAVRNSELFCVCNSMAACFKWQV